MKTLNILKYHLISEIFKILKTWKFYGPLFLSVLFIGCEDYFGEKTDTDFIDSPEYQNRQVAYVPIRPELDQFNEPVDVFTGFDQLIYVVDQGTDEIIALDVAGREVGRK
ncbi:MAG: hypothetical protein ABEH43_07140, partial [Flavobacteriales bacterium]